MDRASSIVHAMGGVTNIVDLTHCATRLRFQLRNSSLVDNAELSALPDVLASVPQAGNRYQVVTGGNVQEVYNEIISLPNFSEKSEERCAEHSETEPPSPSSTALPPLTSAALPSPTLEDSSDSPCGKEGSEAPSADFEKKTAGIEEKTNDVEQKRATEHSDTKTLRGKLSSTADSFLEFLSDSFRPIIGALLGASLIITFMSLMTTLGVIDNWSDSTVQLSASWTFINLLWKSVFTFLPLMVAYNATKKVGADPWVGFAIMGLLMLPGFAKLSSHPAAYTAHLFGTNVTLIDVFGLPLTLFNYSSQVFPPLLIALLLGPLYRFLRKIVPSHMSLLFTPFLAMVIMLPLSAFIIGPIGVYAGAALANGLEAVNTFSPLIFAIAVPTLYPIMVPLGLHWPINALMLLNIAQNGYDYIQGPMGAWNFACFGATAGVLVLAIREKNSVMRQTASGALIAGLVGGISEPSLYGIHLRFGRIYPRIIAGCIVGGAIIGLGGGVTTQAFVFTSVLTVPAFHPIGLYGLAIAASFTVSMLSVIALDYRTPEQREAHPKIQQYDDKE